MGVTKAELALVGREVQHQALFFPSTSPLSRRVLLKDAAEIVGNCSLWRLQVMSMLGIQGKQVGKVREQVADWQLANPSASAQECKEWLESSKETVLARATAAQET